MTPQQKVDDFILKKSAWSEELTMLRQLFQITNLEETYKWGAPVYALKGKNVAGLGAFKSYVGIWFFQGVFLKDKSSKLKNAQEGKTKAMRQWRFESLAEIKRDKKLIQQYIAEAIKNQKDGKEVKPVRGKASEVTMPEELKKFLSENADLQISFKTLTPGQQREYKEYIKEAKMEATKIRRLEKIAPMVKAGKGLNDKYR